MYLFALITCKRLYIYINKQLKKKNMNNNEFKPTGFMTLTNCGGIELMINRSGDGVYYRFNYGQDNLENEEIFEAEILFTVDDGEESPEAFFRHEDVPYYLNQFMKRV